MPGDIDINRRRLLNMATAYNKADVACDLMSQTVALLNSEVRAGMPIGHTTQTVDKALQGLRVAREMLWQLVRKMP